VSAPKTPSDAVRNPEYEVGQWFIDRWSPRSFMNKPVEDQKLFSLFEAARWAPSGNNLQPWKFIVSRSEESRALFLSFISERNVMWCQKAPVLALILSNTEGANGLNRSHAFDAGAAWGYLALEATRQGLVCHAMGGFDRDKARGLLNIPPSHELHAVIAIGYQGDKLALAEGFQEREKPSGRKPQSEFLFEGSFGTSLH
jgi:nitroreductase